MSEPEGRVGVWTDERGACDERGGKMPTAGAPEASGKTLRNKCDKVNHRRIAQVL